MHFGGRRLLLVPIERHHVVVYQVDCFLVLFVNVEVESAFFSSINHFRQVVIRFKALRVGVLLVSKSVLTEHVEGLALRTEMVLEAVVVHEFALHQLLLVVILKQ